ncbi:uncharacterized protein P174DRAFT_297129 [Aspergillus novofumigatus IBT 16806]|uniref:Uncharacterized protein n=1 Tax=Aspergillus novofumigatus (strain IBT 16806) TaxID=1392255 RepID=A0A2I1BYI0_ASPN1|nr:uncharacterized protein P174DRAFT_297129 [Aspergillus novofumigatus IBT 16806]PKX90414.1 hypothetical protein P174DRAFT_297129 [Aspergillus novofumigatus IBT 16806]
MIQPPVPPRKFWVTTYFEQCFDLYHVVEWDPRSVHASENTPSTETEPEERKVERTILICRMYAANRTIKSKIQPEESPLWVWYHTERSMPTPEREAVVLSALLYLDTLNPQTTRILRRPWPQNVSSPRYPAIFLADELLTAVAKRDAIHDAAKSLEECVKFVPAQLLCDVVVSSLRCSQRVRRKSNRAIPPSYRSQ